MIQVDLDEDQHPAVLVVQTIIGHPEQLPTFEEIDYLTPSYKPSTIRSQLGHLIDTDAVATVEGDTATFYGLTADYYNELEEADVLRAEETMQETTLMTVFTQEIENKMELERPDWEPANPYEGDKR